MKLNRTFLFAALIMLSSCLKDITEEENDNEVITTMEVHLTPVGGGPVLVYKFDDPDGPGGSPAMQDTIKMAAMKSYNAELILLDKTKTPVTVVTEDVKSEDVNHRFYYQPSSNSNISINNLDADINGIPLGIKSVWNTGQPGNGTISIVLRHYENGGKALNDDVSSTKSSTDAEIVFNTKCQ